MTGPAAAGPIFWTLSGFSPQSPSVVHIHIISYIYIYIIYKHTIERQNNHGNYKLCLCIAVYVTKGMSSINITTLLLRVCVQFLYTMILWYITYKYHHYVDRQTHCYCVCFFRCMCVNASFNLLCMLQPDIVQAGIDGKYNIYIICRKTS